MCLNRQFELPTYAQISLNLKAFHSILLSFTCEFVEKTQKERLPELMNVNREIKKAIDEIATMQENLREKVEFFDFQVENETIQIDTLESIMKLPPSCQRLFSSQPKRRNLYIPRHKHRGPYRSYTVEEKNHVVHLNRTGMTFASISKRLEIPQKNVVRWCKQGFLGRESSRRIADGEMEDALIEWIYSRNITSLKHSQIQEKARELSSIPQFKASRGWLKNFLKRLEKDRVKLEQCN